MCTVELEVATALAAEWPRMPCSLPWREGHNCMRKLPAMPRKDKMAGSETTLAGKTTAATRGGCTQLG